LPMRRCETTTKVHLDFLAFVGWPLAVAELLVRCGKDFNNTCTS
jgi:hypothetical protein